MGRTQWSQSEKTPGYPVLLTFFIRYKQLRHFHRVDRDNEIFKHIHKSWGPVILVPNQAPSCLVFQTITLLS